MKACISDTPGNGRVTASALDVEKQRHLERGQSVQASREEFEHSRAIEVGERARPDRPLSRAEELFAEILADELKKTPSIVGAEAFAAGKYVEGAKLFGEITASDEYVEFLTLPAYRALA